LFSYPVWPPEPVAPSFGEFIARLTRSPVEVIWSELKSSARYSDGKTAIEWQPLEYLENADV
jgi:hypothetical protein